MGVSVRYRQWRHIAIALDRYLLQGAGSQVYSAATDLRGSPDDSSDSDLDADPRSYARPLGTAGNVHHWQAAHTTNTNVTHYGNSSAPFAHLTDILLAEFCSVSRHFHQLAQVQSDQATANDRKQPGSPSADLLHREKKSLLGSRRHIRQQLWTWPAIEQSLNRDNGLNRVGIYSKDEGKRMIQFTRHFNKIKFNDFFSSKHNLELENNSPETVRRYITDLLKDPNGEITSRGTSGVNKSHRRDSTTQTSTNTVSKNKRAKTGPATSSEKLADAKGPKEIKRDNSVSDQGSMESIRQSLEHRSQIVPEQVLRKAKQVASSANISTDASWVYGHFVDPPPTGKSLSSVATQKTQQTIEPVAPASIGAFSALYIPLSSSSASNAVSPNDNHQDRLRSQPLASALVCKPVFGCCASANYESAICTY